MIAGLAGLSLILNFSIVVLFNLWIQGSHAVMDFETHLVFGKHFRIGTAEIPPYITIKHNENGTVNEVDGFVHQIVLFLAGKFKFTFEYIESSSDNTGFCINNVCNGLIGMIMRGEIDFIATGLGVTLSRSHAIDFTFPFENEPINLLIPYPKKDSTLASILAPFEYKVWILIAVSLIVGAYMLSWSGYIKARWFTPSNQFDGRREMARRRGRISDNLMFLLSVLVNPGYQVPPGFGVAFRILVAGWCLSAIVLSNSYNQSIKSFLMTPKYKSVVSSLDDLTASSEYAFVVKKYSSIWANMIEAKKGPFAKIGNILRKNPENSLETLDDITDLVINQKKVLGQFKSSNLVLIREDMKTNGKCRLYMAEKSFDELTISFGIPKNSHVLNHFLSHEIMWLKQSGMLDYLEHFYWPQKNRCSAPISTKPSSKNEKLTFDYLSGAFLLLGVGLIMSIIAFLIELFTHHYCCCRQRNNKRPLPGIEALTDEYLC